MKNSFNSKQVGQNVYHNYGILIGPWMRIQLTFERGKQISEETLRKNYPQLFMAMDIAVKYIAENLDTEEEDA